MKNRTATHAGNTSPSRHQKEVTPPGELLAEALSRYDLSDPLVGFIRHNESYTCHIRDRVSDTQYLLRIHRPADHFSLAMFGVARPTPAWIQAEMALLETLAGDEALPIQRPVRNRNGEAATLLSDGTAATLLAWLDGETLEAASTREPLPEEAYEAIGRMLAVLHRRSACAATVIAHQRIVYDSALLDRIVGCLQDAASHGIFTHSQMEQAIAGIVAVKAHLARLAGMGRMPRLTHADLSKTNLLLVDSRIAPIDFGLCGLAYAEMDIGSLFSHFTDDTAQRAILRGYAPHAPHPVDMRAVDAYLAYGVLLYLGSHAASAGREDWFPAAMDRWCRDIFTPLADGSPLYDL